MPSSEAAPGHLQRLARSAMNITSTLSLDEIMQRVTMEARELIGAHQAVASLTGGDNGAQTILGKSLSERYARYKNYARVPEGSGIYALVCDSNRPVRLTQEELEAHPAWDGCTGFSGEHPPLRGWLAAPLVAADGGNLGLIQLSDKCEGDFTSQDEAILVQLAQLASLAVQNAKLYEDLQEANRRKDEFLALLGHELRNPLAPIQTALQLMDASGSDSFAREREVIQRQLRHMIQLVDDLLDVSRIVRGKVQLQAVALDLRAVIRQAVEIASPLFEERQHQLELDLPDRPLNVHGDAVRLAQVFSNLLTNAAQYTECGGNIAVRAHRHEHCIRIEVVDDGIGIEPTHMEQIFVPFTQDDRPSDGRGGALGLGLPLVQGLVNLHCGEVWAESDGPGRGSTFVVELPARAGSVFIEELTVASEVEDVDSRLKLLLVDDNVDAAELLTKLLRRMGYEVRCAHDGPAALEVARGFDPHVAILDIGLPVMDGYELGEALREEHNEISLIALTGYGQDADRRKSVRAGFRAHLVKPVDFAELGDTLREVEKDGRL